jgi:thioredoxin reductase (NADPH)
MERVDIAIIGTGPAGISAAITATIRKKKVLLIGNKNLSDKVSKAHLIKNYPGLPEISGADLAAAYKKHLDEMGIEITEDKITLIYPMGDYFSMQGMSEFYEATTVIIASGMVPQNMYEGEEEFLGRGVSYCATCDAPLYKDKVAAIFGFSPKEEAEADFMAEYAKEVMYFPMYKDDVHVAEGIKVIYEKPVSVSGRMKVDTLKTDKNEYHPDGVFFLRDSVSPSRLVPGLEMTDGHIGVDRKMKTNIPGCFACGDVTGTPYQYVKSAGEGNVAALSAVAYLDEMRRNA